MKKKVSSEKTLGYQSFIMNEGQLFKMRNTYYVFIKCIEDTTATSKTMLVIAYDCKKNDYVALSMAKHGNKEITIIT